MKMKSKTNWDHVDSLEDGEIDFSDSPELTEDFFQEAITWPGPKKQITLRLDPDVLDFFRKQGKGYQSNINKVLRKYMEVQKTQAS